jgi:surface protein
MKKHECINVLNNHLPINLVEKIIDYTYTYKFTNKEELKTAIEGYPDNINIYGDCKYWDVSAITDMSEMFYDTQFNGDISKWNVSNVRDMYEMFSESIFNGDISNWDVRNLRNMLGMFNNSKFDGDISNWNVSNVEDISYIFE